MSGISAGVFREVSILMDPYSRKVFSNLKFGAVMLTITLVVYGIVQLVHLLFR